VQSLLLVIAGERDSIVPLEQSRRVYDSARNAHERFLSIPHADHNDAMIEEIARFLGLDGT
jgi:uncharacterized protein